MIEDGESLKAGVDGTEESERLAAHCGRGIDRFSLDIVSTVSGRAGPSGNAGGCGASTMIVAHRRRLD
jgi:hypothetical protein